MTEPLDWLRLAVMLLATIIVPAAGYIVRLALVQSNIRTRLEGMEDRCTSTHGQLNAHLNAIGDRLDRVSNELSGLHAKVDMLIQLNGGSRK